MMEHVEQVVQIVVVITGKNNTTCISGWKKCDECNGTGAVRERN